MFTSTKPNPSIGLKIDISANLKSQCESHQKDCILQCADGTVTIPITISTNRSDCYRKLLKDRRQAEEPIISEGKKFGKAPMKLYCKALNEEDLRDFDFDILMELTIFLL